ncbi:MAG: DUF4364 family protein [Eubacteriales bacterium]
MPKGTIMQLHDKNRQEENRLIILFLYHKMGMPLSDKMIEEYLLDKDWINYFDLKNQLITMVEDGYLEDIEDMRRISSKGIFVLDSFKKEIPFSIREQIDTDAQKNKANIRRKMEIYVNFSQDSSSEFPVILKLKDNNNDALILRVVAATRDEAEKLCKTFEENANSIYADIIMKITQQI